MVIAPTGIQEGSWQTGAKPRGMGITRKGSVGGQMALEEKGPPLSEGEEGAFEKLQTDQV